MAKLTKDEALHTFRHMRDSEFPGVTWQAKQAAILDRVSRANLIGFWDATKHLSWSENYGQSPWENASSLGANFKRKATGDF